MTPLEAAIAELAGEIASYLPGTSSTPLPRSAGYFKLRGLVIGHAYLLRIQALGIEHDEAACERLYRAGTVHFGKAAIPAVEARIVEVLSSDDRKKVEEALASGDLR